MKMQSRRKQPSFRKIDGGRGSRVGDGVGHKIDVASLQWCNVHMRRGAESLPRGGRSKMLLTHNSTDVVSVAASPRCTIEVTCNHVNLLSNHDSTDGADELLGDACLLGVDVAEM